MQLTEELEKILKKYPRGYHAVSKEEIYEILNAYEYQAMSPGWFADWFGVSRETLRLWGKKGIIHYFIVRDKLFRALGSISRYIHSLRLPFQINSYIRKNLTRYAERWRALRKGINGYRRCSYRGKKPRENRNRG